MKTAEQEILNQIYLNIKANEPSFPYNGGELTEEVREEFSDAISEETENFRCSGEDTDFPNREFSRHYDCEEVATVLDNGIAVAWTYWFGGGKHGEPSAIDWMDGAYFVDFAQETLIANVFKKKS